MKRGNLSGRKSVVSIDEKIYFNESNLQDANVLYTSSGEAVSNDAEYGVIFPPLEKTYTSWKNNFRLHFFTIGAAIVFSITLVVLLEYKLVLFLDFTKTPEQWFWKIYSVLSGLFLLSRLIIVLFYDDKHSATYPSVEYPSVSFIITAKNEEGVIHRTIEACMRSVYPGHFECIAVNDGSTDQTTTQMRAAMKQFKGIKGGVRILTFEHNQGKREAMHWGISQASGEIIVVVDSDSFVAPDAIRLIAEHFMQNSKLGAISGDSGVENKDKNMLTKMQSARYGVSYDIFKACESVFGAVSCCAGCFSAYRRSALLPILDRWRTQTFLGTRSTYGDDRSLTNFVLRNWEVGYCHKAKATTVVPEKYMIFFRQQLRWKKSWIREGLTAASFIWRKHPAAATSYYTNLILPILGPVIAINAFLIIPLTFRSIPWSFLGGIISMSVLFGLFYYIKTKNKYWPYLIWFSLLYVSVIVWQMPYAILRLRDTGWGTR